MFAVSKIFKFPATPWFVIAISRSSFDILNQIRFLCSLNIQIQNLFLIISRRIFIFLLKGIGMNGAENISHVMQYFFSESAIHPPTGKQCCHEIKSCFIFLWQIALLAWNVRPEIKFFGLCIHHVQH